MADKHIIFIHGRHYKPEKGELKKNYIKAVRYGLERDYGSSTVKLFNRAKKTMVYYGDLSNAFLVKDSGDPFTKKEMEKDAQDREDTLNMLMIYGKDEFTRSKYKKVRSFTTPIKETFADLLSGPLSLFGVGDELTGLFAPDMKNYWNPDEKWGSDVRWRLTEKIVPAIKRGDDIMLISHSLGTIVSYDVLWKLSHYGEYQYLRDMRKKMVSLFITLGSPLGDENVKGQLKGYGAKGRRRYPNVIESWANFAAEDDYISHDITLKNDFSEMKSLRLIKGITDTRVYNMAVRAEGPNPHHCAGYLITPKVCKKIKEWI